MKTRLMNNWFVGLAVGLLLAMSALGWAGPPWGKGGIPAALKACEKALATCEESSFQMPGDGWPENAYPSGGAPLAYEDNGDGTFTDLNTGLMWEIKTYDGSIHDVYHAYTWSDLSDGDYSKPDGAAFTEFLAALNTPPGFAGYTDWRLPTIKELQTLVDYSVQFPGPTVSGALPGATLSSFYWSSTPYNAFIPPYEDFAWFLNFSNGDLNANHVENEQQVRAVRGGR